MDGGLVLIRGVGHFFFQGVQSGKGILPVCFQHGQFFNLGGYGGQLLLLGKFQPGHLHIHGIDLVFHFLGDQLNFRLTGILGIHHPVVDIHVGIKDNGTNEAGQNKRDNGDSIPQFLNFQFI